MKYCISKLAWKVCNKIIYKFLIRKHTFHMVHLMNLTLFVLVVEIETLSHDERLYRAFAYSCVELLCRICAFALEALSHYLRRHAIVGIICLLLLSSPSKFKRWSGTETEPTLGSIVQKGKFAAWAWAFATRALNKVDFPTFGSPTIPALSIEMGLWKTPAD